MDWKLSLLGEQVFLLQANQEVQIEKIHQSTHHLESLLGEHLIDIVPAYNSIALFTVCSHEFLKETLGDFPVMEAQELSETRVIELPICYEAGLDWEHLVEHTGVGKEDFIAIHLTGTYRNLFMGFMPGFIYADGLDNRLSCPRRPNPRTHIGAGSVGIAGAQTGIYSLDSPGGWNIIGRIPLKLFDPKRSPPTVIEVGERFRFKRITEEEFRRWEN